MALFRKGCVVGGLRGVANCLTLIRALCIASELVPHLSAIFATLILALIYGA